jgi:endonuclease/exonuclease/phosphatase family metal-dependent hydrolase
MRQLFLILSILFSHFAISQSLDDINFGTDSTLDIITWNVENFPKNGIFTKDTVQKIIEALDADIIGFQEISDTNSFKEIINSIPEYDYYIRSYWYAGLAYIYKIETIVLTEAYEIYHTAPYWNAFPRSPLVLEFNFEGENFIIINNHLKCCGDGELEIDNDDDEEFRRLEAVNLLKAYVNANHPDNKVIILGDLNDVLNDPEDHNVFIPFLESDDFFFANQDIALGPSDNWSFPNWPSHLDHIVLSNEILVDFEDPGTHVETIKIDEFMVDGWSSYDYYVSDHRPVGISLKTTGNLSNKNQLKEESYSCHYYPISETLLIRSNLSDCSDCSITIYNTCGKMIESKPIDDWSKNTPIDVSYLPLGLYIINIYNQQGVLASSKFVKY